MKRIVKWDSVIGQDKSLKMLKNMLSTGRMPHALLFVGPEGVGKMRTAKIMAAALLCQSQENQPCGQCASCQKIEQGVHPDYSVVQPIEASSIKIEQIRALQRAAAVAPYFGKYKVCIIEDAETMTTQAANSLLKVLEEPVVNVVFILIASKRHLLLDTIISRCQVMSFQPIAWDQITQLLISEGVVAEKAEAAARLSGGRIGAARELLAPDGFGLRDKASDVLSSLSGDNIRKVWDFAAEFDKGNRQEVRLFLTYFIFLMRDILMLLVGRGAEVLFNPDIGERLKNESLHWREKRVLAALDEVRQAVRAVEANANVRLTLEAMLIKLIDLKKGG